MTETNGATVRNGAGAKSPTIVLAALDFNEPLRTIIRELRAAQLSVISVTLNAGQCDQDHQKRLLDISGELGSLILGGFSLGARIAAQLCSKGTALGLLGIGFPFHLPHDPSVCHGLQSLLQVNIPTQIIQGTRDNHGSQPAVRGYPLTESISVVWMADANHRLVPRSRSVYSHQQHLAAAARHAVSFVNSMGNRDGGDRD